MSKKGKCMLYRSMQCILARMESVDLIARVLSLGHFHMRQMLELLAAITTNLSVFSIQGPSCGVVAHRIAKSDPYALLHQLYTSKRCEPTKGETTPKGHYCIGTDAK
jgi:hypothetical protein